MEAQLEEKNQELQRVTSASLFLTGALNQLPAYAPAWAPLFVAGTTEGEDEWRAQQTPLRHGRQTSVRIQRKAAAPPQREDGSAGGEGNNENFHRNISPQPWKYLPLKHLWSVRMLSRKNCPTWKKYRTIFSLIRYSPFPKTFQMDSYTFGRREAIVLLLCFRSNCLLSWSASNWR